MLRSYFHIAYLAASRWLMQFAYHAEVGVGVFLFIGFVALALMLLSIGYQSVKAALGDPVEPEGGLS